jgi:Fe2+ transport system protein FeoA
LKAHVTREGRVYLSDVKKGDRVKIKFYCDKLPFRMMLYNLGLLPGDSVDILEESILGSPISIGYGNGEHIAIRKAEARFIEVVAE